jgi:general secretion pathway protein N
LTLVKLWHWLAVGVGAYLAFTLSSFPAATAYAWFAPASLQLAGIEGTVWSGRAAVGAVAQLPLHDVRWRVSAWPLLLGRVSADLRAQLDDGFVTAQVNATRRRVELDDVRASTSLPALRSFLPIAGVRGAASLKLSKLDLDVAKAWPTKVVGELTLAQLETAPLIAVGPRGTLVPLGNYIVRFVDNAGGINATINDTGGPLELSGTFVLDAARTYKIDARIKPRADAPQELVDGLNVVTADPDAEGRRPFTWSGTL